MNVIDIKNIMLTAPILDEVGAERFKQIEKWGVQDHPDVATSESPAYRKFRADYAKMKCEAAALGGVVTWHLILKEELAEAVEQAALKNMPELRKELVQCAAVCVAWIEDIDRRPK